MARTRTRILQISDLHFGPPFLQTVAEALLRKIQLLTPDVIVVSGDITQRARRYQFEMARAFFDSLAPECSSLPAVY